MTVEEDLVYYICQRTAENCKTEIKNLGVNPSKLLQINTPFKRISYTEAIEKLNSIGYKIKWGEDLGFDDEKALAKSFGNPFFIYDYPKRIKAFYCKTDRTNEEIVMSADMLVPRIGEISTGGAREDDKEKLLKRLGELGLNKKDYDWYIDLRRYGTVPHVGFGLGVERLLGWILELENIMDAIPFPRTTRRFYP